MSKTLSGPLSQRIVIPAPFELWIAVPLVLAALSIALALTLPAVHLDIDETEAEAGSAFIANL